MSTSTKNAYACAHLRDLRDGVLLQSIKSFRRALRLLSQAGVLARSRAANPYVQEMVLGLAAMEGEWERRKRERLEAKPPASAALRFDELIEAIEEERPWVAS